MSAEVPRYLENLKGEVRLAGRIIAGASQNIVDGSIFDQDDVIKSIAIASAHSETGIRRSFEDAHQASYAAGAMSALSSVLTGLQERGLRPDAKVDLEKPGTMTVLAEIAKHPGFGAGSLVDQLISKNPQTSVTQVAHYASILEKIGFIEPAIPIDSSKWAWKLTPWGIEIFAKLEEEKNKKQLKDRINASQEKAQSNI